MSMWLMYWVVMLDSISVALIVATFLLLPLSIILRVIAFKLHDDDYRKDVKGYKQTCRKINKLLIISVSLFVITTFIPNTKEAAAIYLIPKIINNKQIKKMPDKLVTLANDWMDEQIKTIKSK